ncbi:MAG: transketolase C-terminal domain-containing protein, partial [Terriglobales bacterium]
GFVTDILLQYPGGAHGFGHHGAAGYDGEVFVLVAWILKQDFGYETRVLNVHTLKPLDTEAIVRAARDTGVVLTAEEHQIGALAWPVANAITQSPALYGIPTITGAIGVKDRFGDSGAPWELIKEFEVSAEHIAAKAVELIGVKKSRSGEPMSEVHLVGTK